MSTELAAPPQTHWQQLANGYDSVMSRDPAMAMMYRAIVAELPADARTILDLGTGTGSLLTLARRICPTAHLVGLDPAPAMLEQAQQKAAGDSALEFVLGSAHQLDFPDAQFDVVMSNFALHHLTHAEKPECAREIHRVLRPGGRLIYGDQHCRRMGGPSDLSWVEDVFELYTMKARHYLHTAGLERMILQVKLLPAFLLADGEIPATVEFWCSCFEAAGFSSVHVASVGPEQLLNRVVVAVK